MCIHIVTHTCAQVEPVSIEQTSLLVYYKHSFQRVCCFTDTKCFEGSLSRCKVSGFLTYRELRQFVRKLCYRSLLPKHLPEETDWTGLCSLQGETLTQLSSREFLNRLKLNGDLDVACRARAKREVDYPQSVHTNLEATVEVVKEEFASKACGYLVYLLERFLDDISFNSDIVRGMSCFDSVVILSVPFNQSALCFSTLYYSFSLRGWMSNTPETEARDEYFEFVDFFRNKYQDFRDAPETFTDMIELLTPMPKLRSRRHLFYLFQLSCLCLTSQIP